MCSRAEVRTSDHGEMNGIEEDQRIYGNRCCVLEKRMTPPWLISIAEVGIRNEESHAGHRSSPLIDTASPT